MWRVIGVNNFILYGEIMSSKKVNDTGFKSGRQARHRFRGLMQSKPARAVGITSIVAPLIGYVIKDLQKPESFTRQLISTTINKLKKPVFKKVETIDITDEVEMLDENNDNNEITNN